MPKKNDRAIAEPVTVGDKLYKPGQEDALAAVAPQWNIDQMASKGWLIGDWSNAGLTPDEEAEAVEETVATAAKKSGRKTGR